MADRIEVRVDGTAQVRDQLLTLTKDLAYGLSYKDIADEGMRLAVRFAPRRSGRLASSIKGRATKTRATIRAGGTKRVPYAGAVNYGYRRRNIDPANFMGKADAVLRRTAPRDLQKQVIRLIRRQGLS